MESAVILIGKERYFMEGNIAEIAESFGLKPQKIIKSKYFYILFCKEGQYRLYSPSMTEEEILILAKIKACLEKNNIITDSLAYSKQLPYVKNNDEIYIALKGIKGNNICLDNKKHILSTAQAIGTLHQALKEISPQVQDKKVYSRAVSRLRQIKSIINRKNKTIAVDVLFLRNYDLMCELCDNIIDMDKNSDNIYIHGSLKEENIIVGSEISFANWNGINVDSPLKDFAYFINRYVKKYALLNDDYVSFDELALAYSKGVELNEENLRLLKALVLYPEKYIKVVDNYYKHPKTFTPVYIGNKIQQCGEISQFLKNYVSYKN